MEQETLLELCGLTKRFGSITAVTDMSFSVARGEVLGFLGPNGAGKSTTMKMVAGFLPPSAGTAFVEGYDVQKHPVEVKSRIGYLPEGAPLYAEMTPASLLHFVAKLRGLSPRKSRERIAEAVERLELQKVYRRPIETLSKGFKRRVGLAQAILHDPDILILDEPTDGLDPNQKHQVRELLRAMSDDKAIVISTHILEEVTAVCNRAIVIDKGRVLADETPLELQSRSAYHKAVFITLPPQVAEQATRLIGALPSVRTIEGLAGSNGAIQLVALPRKGEDPLREVRDSLKQQGIPLNEIYQERGRMEDVFRDLTLGQAKGDQ